MPRRAALFTEIDMRRIIRAAKREGLRIVGIQPNGTLITDDGKGPHPLLPGSETLAEIYGDDEPPVVL